MNGQKNLSKSRYLNGMQCPRLLWVAVNDAGRLPPVDAATQQAFDQGHYVEELAHRLYPAGLNLYSDNLSENLRETKASLPLRQPLFEAGFSVNRLYCRVDILNPVGADDWDIIEVKSTTEIRDEHLHDVAFQQYCCKLAGLSVAHCRIMYLNKDYVKQGEIDPQQLFISEDVTDRLEVFSSGIEERIADMLVSISSEDCPESAIGQRCNSPYPCLLQEECWAHLPEHHVMTLYYGKKLGEELLGKGILHIGDIPQDVALNFRQQIQKECVVCGKEHINRREIRKFLEGLVYPLYFMDFETFTTAVPIYDGTHPYQNIPFQFSVHAVQRPGAAPQHLSYLAEGKDDPRPAFLAALKEAIGPQGTVLVYYEPFERSRLKELAEAFPKYRKWIDGILARTVDLITPFKDFSYYHPSQKGSASIKKVMPALTDLSYDEMAIAEGEMASLKYMEATFKDISAEERQKIHADLLAYCEQDTGGMVRIVEKLVALCTGQLELE